ncbi:NAD/NADP octopine/nopaline dehydrogenase family protein [Epibacterium ulvae]|uniref:NAD/NADP octopine/nopaline dehydrogenase family protein n=1 Tax=Epibacterium ulvae TaxID=1156985 RepID=UPI0024927474|nr:NAD/NADP octopine/nopaline dehydrogenase family protein [Epibacterium ulvae]
MRIAILGTGGIALGYAALLDKVGHSTVLYSLSGKSASLLNNQMIDVSGAFEHQFQARCVADISEALNDAEAIIVATTANHHAAMFDQVVPHICVSQHILISAELSLSADHLEKQLAKANKIIPVTALSSTILTGRRIGNEAVKIGLMRKVSKAATTSAAAQDAEIAFWQSIFGEIIQSAPSRLWLAFSNLNPTVHVGNAMLNFTRIEKGEDWGNFDGMTAGVGALTEALDQERCKVAAAYDVSVTPLLDQYQANFGFKVGTGLAEMAKELHIRRGGLPKGPRDPSTRYITEDIPFGTCFIETYAKKRGISTPLHSAAIDIVSAIYGRDFRTENKFGNDP